MRNLWIDEVLEVGAILYQRKHSADHPDGAWARVIEVRQPMSPMREDELRKETNYALRLITGRRTVQHSTVSDMIKAGLQLWEPPPLDPEGLEKWLASDQPSPPTGRPGTP